MAAYEKMILISETEYLDLKGMSEYKTHESRGTQPETPRPETPRYEPPKPESPETSRYETPETHEISESTIPQLLLENELVDAYERTRFELGVPMLDPDEEQQLLDMYLQDLQDVPDVQSILSSVKSRVMERDEKHAAVKEIMNETHEAIRSNPSEKEEIVNNMSGAIIETLIPEPILATISDEDMNDIQSSIKSVNRSGLMVLVDITDDYVREQEYLMGLGAEEEVVTSEPEEVPKERSGERMMIAHEKFLESGVYDAMHTNVFQNYDNADLMYQKFLKRVVSDAHKKGKRLIEVEVDLDHKDRPTYEAIQLFKKLCRQYPNLLAYAGDVVRREFKKENNKIKLPPKELPPLSKLKRKPRAKKTEVVTSTPVQRPAQQVTLFSPLQRAPGWKGLSPGAKARRRTRQGIGLPPDSPPKRKIHFDPEPQPIPRKPTRMRRRGSGPIRTPSPISEEEYY
jgi:hypothetical protein